MKRRDFLTLPALAAAASARTGSVPVGIELYSVRNELKKDLMGTVAAIAKMGYEVVEFYSPYFEWTDDYAKEVRRHLDDLGIACRSMHSPARAFEPENRRRAIDLNSILGSRDIVMASPGRRITDAAGWKRVADTLSAAQFEFEKAGLRAGYHNHGYEWRAVPGVAPLRHGMDILAAGTPDSVTLQLDVGTCLDEQRDPVEWIRSHPGRIRSIHCKDWAPGGEEAGKGYRVLTGEGIAPWKEIIAAAEEVGGVEFYLIEQEGSRLPELETAERCLQAWRKIAA